MRRSPARTTYRPHFAAPRVPSAVRAHAGHATTHGGMRLRSTLLVPALALAACGDDDGPGVTPPEATHAGAYSITQLNQAVTCAPAALPAPVPNEEGFWWSLPPSGSADTRLLVTVDATEYPGVGRLISFAGLAGGEHYGVLAGDGTFTVAQARQHGLEGPREGGDRFGVEERLDVSGAFERSGGQTRVDAAGTLTYQYWHSSDGVSADGLFTTCAQPFTLSGGREGG